MMTYCTRRDNTHSSSSLKKNFACSPEVKKLDKTLTVPM